MEFPAGTRNIIGEIYTVSGTSQKAFCRSKRVISEADECISGICKDLCIDNIPDEEYIFHYYANTETVGLAVPDKTIPAYKFLCEEP